MGNQQILIVAAIVAVVLLIIFVRIIRFTVMLALRLAIFFVAVFVAVGGLMLLMNNETIFEKPGWKPRVMRFITAKSAATSEKGLGSAVCMWGDGRQQKAAAPVVPVEIGAPHHDKNGGKHRGKGKGDEEQAGRRSHDRRGIGGILDLRRRRRLPGIDPSRLPGNPAPEAFRAGAVDGQLSGRMENREG